MELFLAIPDALQACPDWVVFILLPALEAAAAALFTLLGGRRAYPAVSVALGGAGFVLLCSRDALSAAFVYGGLFAVLAALLRLLFFCPTLPGRKRRTSREERIYQKFRGEPLAAAPYAAQPAFERCFGEEAPAEAPPELSHALSLLQKLQREKLTAADRLEADVLMRSVSALKCRTLDETERGVLNDCLASVLKLTAKYKL